MALHPGQSVRLLITDMGVEVGTVGVIKCQLGGSLAWREPVWEVQFPVLVRSFGVYESWLEALGPGWFNIWMP